jgi:hypothetical protein
MTTLLLKRGSGNITALDCVILGGGCKQQMILTLNILNPWLLVIGVFTSLHASYLSAIHSTSFPRRLVHKLVLC